MIVSYYIIYTNHFDRPGIKAPICKMNNFSIFTSICLKYYCTQLSCGKNNYEELILSEPKFEKVNISNQSPTKIFCISVFNVGVA